MASLRPGRVPRTEENPRGYGPLDIRRVTAYSNRRITWHFRHESMTSATRTAFLDGIDARTRFLEAMKRSGDTSSEESDPPTREPTPEPTPDHTARDRASRPTPEQDNNPLPLLDVSNRYKINLTYYQEDLVTPLDPKLENDGEPDEEYPSEVPTKTSS